MKDSNILLEKSENYADRIIKLYLYLEGKLNHKLLEQLLKSGTSIGANISESVSAQSKIDFISKLEIALKEANETEFWLKRFKNANFITDIEYKSLLENLIEIKKLLVSSIRTSKRSKLSRL